MNITGGRLAGIKHPLDLEGENSGEQPLPKKSDTKTSPTSSVVEPVSAKGCSSLPVYQAYFVENQKEYERLMAHVWNSNSPEAGHALSASQLAIITTPEDFHNDGLMHRLTVKKDGVFDDQEGALFSENPVTLVLDFRQLQKNNRLPELNELFEQPARLGGKILGPNVKIVSLLSSDMVPAKASETHKPGPDFWWRINASSPPVPVVEAFSDESPLGSPDAFLSSRIGDAKELDANSVEEYGVIDFTGKDWRAVLLGSPAINEAGKLVYEPGQLEQNADKNQLILKNAPWEDPAFSCQLASIIKDGQFFCNGATKSLSPSLIFYRAPLDAEALKALRESVRWERACSDSNTPMIVLNKDNFQFYTQTLIINKSGMLRSQNTLQEHLQGMKGLRVSSPLTEEQWVKLITLMQEQGLTDIPIYCDEPELQPGCFGGKPLDKPLPVAVDNPHITMTASKNQVKGEQEFVVTPEDSLIKISQRSRIECLETLQFECRSTQLLEALRRGEPVSIRGLESNPVLLRQLETLLSTPPYLTVFGEREDFPNLRLTIIWPEDSQPDSVLWQQHLSHCAEPMEFEADNPLALQHADLFSQFQQFMTVLSTLKARTFCPSSPPDDWNGLFEKVIRQARVEAEMDGFESFSESFESPGAITNAYFHKAMRSIVLKEYRANAEVYAYLKVQSSQIFCPETAQPEIKINIAGIRDWLQKQPFVSPKVIENNFWSLAQHFTPCPFPLEQEPFEDSINILSALLVEVQQQFIESSTKFYFELPEESKLIAKQLLKGVTLWNKPLEKAVSDLLISLGAEGRQSGLVSTQVAAIVKAVDSRNEENVIRALKAVLSESRYRECAKDIVPWLMKTPFTPDWQLWETRRLKRLKDKVLNHPVVFIKGETGAGKSHIASMVAEALNPDKQCHSVINIGPDTSVGDLFGEYCLNKSKEGSQTRLVPGPMKQWIEQKSDKPVILVIDEANLATPELWDCLRGLYETPPCIHYQGERLPVSDQHRIIMTGNPDHFSGRRMNAMLRAKAPQLYYTPLDHNFLTEKILRKELETLLADSGLTDSSKPSLRAAVQHGIQVTESLYKGYKTLLPQRLFSPRDLTDSLSRMKEYLRVSALSPEGGDLSLQTLNALISQSLSDTLGGEFSGVRKNYKKAIRSWFERQWVCDRALLQASEQQFEVFYDHWLASGSKKNLELGNDSVKQLTRQLWTDTTRCQIEKATGQRHSGRHATVVEGPAGRGKSLLMDQFLTRMQTEAGQPVPRQVNAGLLSYGQLKEAVQKAKEQGHMLIISEINVLKSQQIEGLLNDATTGQAAPGFHLFTTINPSSFQGRHEFSPALKSRFNRILIDSYSPDDLLKIARSRFDSQAQADTVHDWHMRLLQVLQNKKSPILPTAADLCALAGRVGLATDTSLQASFKKQYQLYLTTAGYDLDNLPPLPEDDGQRVEVLIESLQQTLNIAEPVAVVKDEGRNNVYFDGEQHSLKVGSQINETDITVDALKQLAQVNWKKHGMPVECPEKDDTLFSAIFHQWQRTVFSKNFPQYVHKAEEVIPLSREEQMTLELEANKNIVSRALDVCQQTPCQESLQHLQKIIYQPERKEYQQQAIEMPEPESKDLSDAIPAKLAPLVIEQNCDNKTGKQENVMDCDAPIIFPNGKSEDEQYRSVRWEVKDLIMTRDGIIKTLDQKAGQMGLNVILPEPLSPPFVFADNERYGVVRLSGLERLQVLPSLTPQHTIDAIYTVPAIPLEHLEIVQDRHTGCVLIRVRDDLARESIDNKEGLTIHYRLKIFSKPKGAETSVSLPVESSSLTRSIAALMEQSPELKARFNQPTKGDLLWELTRYCKKFRDKPLEKSASDCLLWQLIKQRKGTCRHRSWAFYALANYYGVPVRIVQSQIHAWVEYSADGVNWEEKDLGGGGTGRVDPVKQNTQPFSSGLRLSESNVESLACEARKDVKAFAKKYNISIEEVLKWLENPQANPLKIDIHRLLQSENGDPDVFIQAVELVERRQLDPIYLKLVQTAFCNAFFKHPERSDELGQVFLRLTAHLTEQQIKNVLLTIARGAGGIIRYVRTGIRIEPSFLLGKSLDKKAIENFIAVCFEKCSDLSFAEKEMQALLDAFPGLYKVPQFKPCVDKYYSKTCQSLSRPLPTGLPVANTSRSGVVIKGRSPSLEQRIRQTEISEKYTWQSEGLIDAHRLLSYQAPFKSQAVAEGCKPVKIVLNQACRLEFGSMLRTKVIETIAQFMGTPDLKALDRENYDQFQEIRDSLDESFDPEGLLSDVHDKMILIEYLTLKDIDEIKSTLKKLELPVPEKLKKLLSILEQALPLLKDLEIRLQSSFLHYFVQRTNAQKGNLTVYRVGDNDETTGYRKVSGAKELQAELRHRDITEKGINTEPLAGNFNDGESIFMNSEDVRSYFNEFVSEVDLMAYIQEKLEESKSSK